jgi:hypothetical protein
LARPRSTRLHLLAWLVVVAAGPVATAGLATTAGASSTERVYVANRGCVGRAFKPTRITIACGTGQFYADALRYTAYGRRSQAHATGILVLDDCTPNCAEGTFRPHPGTVTLKSIERCAGRLFYTRVTWSYAGRSPVPARSGSASIAPFKHCSRVLR